MTFSIAETKTFSERINRPEFRRYYPKIKDYVYPILRRNPFFGPNIKRLKGEYLDFYRYRIGDYRLFYQISSKTVMVYVVDIEHRSQTYE
jgi:mRNA interferase RelE/StbE